MNICRCGTAIMFGSVVVYCGLAVSAEQEKVEKKAQPKEVSLASVYSTSGQKGLIKIRDNADGFQKPLEELHRRVCTTGSSNIFLARSDNIQGAVQATCAVYLHGLPVDQPVSVESEPKSKQYWLVAFLGLSGSTPPAWNIVSFEIDGNVLRLKTAEHKGELTLDTSPYLYWIPLEGLSPGRYALELFDAGKKLPTLVRYVNVP